MCLDHSCEEIADNILAYNKNDAKRFHCERDSETSRWRLGIFSTNKFSAASSNFKSRIQKETNKEKEAFCNVGSPHSCVKLEERSVSLPESEVSNKQ